MNIQNYICKSSRFSRFEKKLTFCVDKKIEKKMTLTSQQARVIIIIVKSARKNKQEKEIRNVRTKTKAKVKTQ